MKNKLYLLLSFLFPVASLLVVYKIFGFHPFGEKTMLVMDMNAQYINFYEYFRRTILEGGSFLYSWAKGPGGNMTGLFSYYISSPLNLILVLFPKTAVPEGVLVLTLFKTGLSGLTFAVFLRYAMGKSDVSTVAFSVMYALMSYAIVYSSCPMWIDSVILMPLVLLGTEKILKEKKCLLFTLSYAAAVMSNYYTAYMLTIFTAIFFIYRFVIINEGFPVKLFLNRLAHIAVCGLIGVGVSCWLLLPSFYETVGGKLAYGTYSPDDFFNQNYTKLARKLFLGQHESLTNYGLPPVFCGSVITLLWFIYYANKNIKLKHKAATSVVLAVMLVSFAIVGVDKVWHIFKYPAWFPYRYAFVFCFFSVYIGFYSYTKLDKSSPYVISACGAALSAVLFVMARFYPDFFMGLSKAAFATVLLTMFYTAVLVFKNKSPAGVAIVLTVAVAAEMGVNAYHIYKGIDKEFRYVTHSSYAENTETLREGIKKLKQDDPGFYRIEKTFLRTDNDAMSMSYNGLSHYSSTFYNSFNVFNYNMGMIQEYMACRYQGSSIPTDALFGVKYIVSDKKMNETYQKAGEIYPYTVYQNPYALPVAYMTEKVQQQRPQYSSDFLYNQNEVLKQLSGIRFFYPVSASLSLNVLSFTADNSLPVYISLPNKFKQQPEITVNGARVPYEYEANEKKVCYLGRFEPGDKVEVSLPFAKQEDLQKLSCGYFDEGAFGEWIKETKQNQLEITSYSDTKLEGTINVGEKTTMFTSIVYDKGWTVYVDGVKTAYQKALDTFISVEIPRGSHKITFSYMPEGLATGMVISFVSLVVAVILFIITKKRRGGDNVAA